jgi:type IV pilus assembly protein PilN
MIRINLLPVKQAAQAERQRQEITRAGLGFGLLLVLAIAVRLQQGRELAAAEERIGELETALRALDSQVRDVNDLDVKKKALDSKLKVIADLGRKRVGPVGVMSDLAQATPDRVWLTDFSEAGGSATITGQAVDNQIVAEFLRNLSTSPYFTTVDLVETTQDQAGDIKLRKFIVRANINYAATPKTAEAPGSKS